MKLFIDDERLPPGTENDPWFIVRSSQEAIAYFISQGIPPFISFDHDLGGDDNAMIIVNWLIDEVLDGRLAFPECFRFTVHSQNPVGKKNIEECLGGFLNHLQKEKQHA